MILDHIGPNVSDYERSKASFDPGLGAFVSGPDGHSIEAVCLGSPG